jgi:hypothetical protein
MSAGMIIPAILGGLQVASQFSQSDKGSTKQQPKMNAQQRRMFNILSQLGMSRLGTWIDTPKGKVFQYNPDEVPEYELPRYAPLTNLQQQTIQQGSDLGNMQSQVLGGQRPSYSQMLAGYQPGNIQALAGQMGGGLPQMQSTPYQFNEMALTGMGPGRPDIQKETKQFSVRDKYMPEYTIPKSTGGVYNPWAGQMTTDRLASVIENYGGGSYECGGYMPKRNYMSGGMIPKRNYQDGGLMSNLSQYNLVGEAGPEMHITNTGRMNMVGENGPELFNPNEAGYIVPNNELPNTARFPQQNTGRETSMVSPEIYNYMSRAGMGMQEGGEIPSSRWYYGQDNQAYEVPEFQKKGDFFDWQKGAGADAWGAISQQYGTQTPWKTYQQNVGMWDPEQRRDYGASDWAYNPEQNVWSTQGQQDQWTPDGFTWNPAMETWEMQGSTSQYQQPFEGWQWSTPGESQTGQAMWTPQGYQFPTAVEEPTPEPYQWQSGSATWNPATGTWGIAAPETAPGADLGMTYNYATGKWEMPALTNQYAQAPFEGWQWSTPGEAQTGQAMWTPQGFTGFEDIPITTEPPEEPEVLEPLDFTVDPTQLQTATGAEWWAEQYPEEYAALQDLIGQETPDYVYDPEQISQQWTEQIFDPSMQAWQQSVAPWISEQFGATGNVYGGERPAYLTQAAQDYAATLQPYLAEMQSQGRQLEATAVENMMNRRAQALNQITGLAGLPSQVGYTQAQTQDVINEIEKSQITLPTEMGQALANIDLTYAGMDQIYDQLSFTNPNVSDSQKIDNIIKLASLDSMQGSALSQQIQTIGMALDNLSRLQNIAQPEALTTQNILTGNYEDWVNAVGPENLQTANSYLMGLLGYSTTENIVTMPQSPEMDLSWLGQIFAGQGNTGNTGNTDFAGTV